MNALIVIARNGRSVGYAILEHEGVRAEKPDAEGGQPSAEGFEGLPDAGAAVCKQNKRFGLQTNLFLWKVF